jgi:hypothetical protein
MEARYAFRTNPLRDACQMAPEVCAQAMPRLSTVMQPLVRLCQGQAADHHATTDVGSLLAHVAGTNMASMASRCGPSRLPLPRCLGWDAWDQAPGRAEVRRHVQTHVGPGAGVWGCEPAGLPTAGREAVGGQGRGGAAWAQSIPATWPSPGARAPARGIRIKLGIDSFRTRHGLVLLP